MNQQGALSAGGLADPGTKGRQAGARSPPVLLGWAPGHRLFPEGQGPGFSWRSLTSSLLQLHGDFTRSPQTPPAHRLLFGLRQETESAHLEGEGSSVQRLSDDVLKPMEDYLRPLFPLLSCPEAGYLSLGCSLSCLRD